MGDAHTILSVLVLLAAPSRQFARQTTFVARISKKPCANAVRQAKIKPASRPADFGLK
jgi:hypothetical protein